MFSVCFYFLNFSDFFYYYYYFHFLAVANYLGTGNVIEFFKFHWFIYRFISILARKCLKPSDAVTLTLEVKKKIPILVVLNPFLFLLAIDVGDVSSSNSIASRTRDKALSNCLRSQRTWRVKKTNDEINNNIITVRWQRCSLFGAQFHPIHLAYYSTYIIL